MMLYVYGDTKPITFQLVDSSGSWVTGHTFAAADVLHYGWNGATWSTVANEGANCAEVGNGAYTWTPSVSSKTQYEIVLIQITDSTGSTFVDNSVHLYTVGNDDAYHDG